ncbi:hypothetical protein [Desmospora profundinema]|uniref:Uncharacterized protein n=1 Tax=Desmospora profundinema TaxID=1571184 RepID=A0ABU1IM92_9BACL|nr:hypothetical protein [Desmospora profundinema]MDR6225904.1 hypothetical protein [Desmospora profundinema]
MNVSAAVFACRFTGVVGILASLLFWNLYGFAGLVFGLLSSMFWFGLAWHLQRGSKSQK